MFHLADSLDPGALGSLAAGGTRFQAAAGIDDSPRRHADDILRALLAARDNAAFVAEARVVDLVSKDGEVTGVVVAKSGALRAAMVWDAAAMAATRESEMMRECLAAGAVQDRATLGDLAASLHLTAEQADRALTPLPGRRRLTAPYHLAWVTHGLLATQGGLVIDPSGRVLDEAGAPIPGLYAGGGTACGLAGPHSDGYLSGNGLLSAFGMGWIIGNRLAERTTRPQVR
ncbi:FAD-binding protein [Actinomadura sp. NPDC049753]|uniref:FAD-binding protein n=1 Tax=Actinomadura sp. NPDC049753 TaxID=3154739 RepID=UPI0034413815